jgi:hypothetical protein
MAKCPVSSHALLNAVPVPAIVRLDADGNVEIEWMKGAFFLGITPESLGIDSADKAGRKFGVDVLSAKFTL